ncbi:Hypothetical predicted protein [Podarcis lilfordi]|uniref:Uncharacterized protein n=1 Tax=Podarcis lilfordi TaxID=74358 RepID=A0AA35JY69_9SAUR|nr:Hypothetical predicted protein [Podarcis lilfordi]
MQPLHRKRKEKERGGGNQTDSKPKARWNNSVLQALRKDIRSCRAMVSRGRAFHQAGASVEKALALVEANLTSLGPGTTRVLLFMDLKVFRGAYQESIVDSVYHRIVIEVSPDVVVQFPSALASRADSQG